MPIKNILLTLIALLLPSLCLAAQPTLDSALPPLAIADKGEIHLQDDDIVYRPWSSDTNPGKVHVVQYLAGTRSASEVYSPFTDALMATYPVTDFHVTTIINLDDAMWGTSGLVVSEVEASKREFPNSTLVLDKDGTGRENWQLKKKSAALAILDESGKVLFFTQEPLSSDDMESAMALVKTQIDS